MKYVLVTRTCNLIVHLSASVTPNGSYINVNVRKLMEIWLDGCCTMTGLLVKEQHAIPGFLFAYFKLFSLKMKVMQSNCD